MHIDDFIEDRAKAGDTCAMIAYSILVLARSHAKLATSAKDMFDVTDQIGVQLGRMAQAIEPIETTP